MNNHFTDAGNAGRFLRDCGEKLRFNRHTGKWMVYDGTRWNPDGGADFAKCGYMKTASALYTEIHAGGTPGEQKDLLRWAIYSESAGGCRNALYYAQSAPQISAGIEDFDHDMFLFNCLDGTLDLRTGVLKPHSPVDMLTQLAPVRFEGDKGIELWMECLKTWHRGDTETIEYLQKLAGMCLTGDTTSRVFPIFFGHGKNGKSVFLDTLIGLMGDYASVAPRTLLKETRNDGHATEIADLLGKRLIIASETGKEMRLKTSLVKAMTGDMKMKGRFMRQDFFDFKLTNKTILVTQNLPIIDESSDAIWDRVHKLEWGVRIPDKKQDPNLLEKLKGEWTGILGWAVEGCKKWQREGILRPTNSIRSQTEIYRKQQLPLSDFIKDMCVVAPSWYVPMNMMYAAYNGWGGQWATLRQFNVIMRELGYLDKGVKIGGKNTKCWVGIGLCSS